jgi:hypothetical protein
LQQKQRTWTLLQRLSSQKQQKLIALARERVYQQSGSVWADGKEPLAFDAFCQRLGVTLRPHQADVFVRAGIVRAWDIIRPSRQVSEIILMWGKGSGKDLVASLLVVYASYVLLHLKGDPAVYFGLKPGTQLHIVNVAPTEDQARQVFFEYVRQHLECSLFKPFLSDPKKQILADEVRFRQKNLLLLSKHSRSGSLEGYNVFIWIMDEADDFVTTEHGGSNAERVHRIFRSSAATRLGNRSLGFVISYPRTADGFMMRLEAWYKQEKELMGEQCSIFFDRATTTQVRPEVNIETNVVMQADYRNDPTLAAAYYECLPMPTDCAFFEFSDKIEEAVEPSRTPIAIFEPLVISRPKDNTMIEYVSGQISNIRRERGCTYYLAGDGGLKGDSFALAVFHTDDTQDALPYICERCAAQTPELLNYANYGQEREHTRPQLGTRCGICGREPNTPTGLLGWWVKAGRQDQELLIGGAALRIPHVYEDLLIEFEPHRRTPTSAAKPVDFPGVQEICRELIVHLNITQARFDPWNAASIVQGLQSSTGRDVEEISFAQPEQYRRARLVKAMLYSNMITLLPNAKRDKEWKQLQRKGQKIDHPQQPGASKDLYDAEAVAIWLAATSKCANIELGWL